MSEKLTMEFDIMSIKTYGSANFVQLPGFFIGYIQ